MEKQMETELPTEKKSKKAHKESAQSLNASSLEISETKAMTIKITFDGEAAKKILKCESELRERLSKPDMGKILGHQILAWSDEKWTEIVEENTDIEYFFAQIKKCSDKAKSIKLLKDLSERLADEKSEEQFPLSSDHVYVATSEISN